MRCWSGLGNILNDRLMKNHITVLSFSCLVEGNGSTFREAFGTSGEGLKQ